MDNEDPSLQCGEPTEDYYIIGQIDTVCIQAEANENWVNYPETVSRFECGRLLKSDFVNYEERINLSVLLSIPHVNGIDCEDLSPNAIQIGKYEFLQGNNISEPGLAGFSISIDRQIYATWASGLEQSPESYFEVTAIEDAPADPTWHSATQFKKVTGKINCQIRSIDSNEAPIEVQNLEFSIYMVY